MQPIEILDVALMTLVAIFCVTFNVGFAASLLSVTEVASKKPVYALITLAFHRLNENTSGPDLLTARFVKSEDNYLDVRIKPHLTVRPSVMARLISGGKPHSVELQNFFCSPEELRASRACPSEHRIEGQLHLTQEQIPLSTEIMEHLTAMLQDHDFNVQESRKPVGGPLSGTERIFYPINARANVFDHSNVGVARMGPTDQLEKAGAMDRTFRYVVTDAEAMWIAFTYSGRRHDARQKVRRKAADARRRVGPTAAQEKHGEAEAEGGQESLRTLRMRPPMQLLKTRRRPVQRPGSHSPGGARTPSQRATRSCLRRSRDR
jgi:hypothetical protein